MSKYVVAVLVALTSGAALAQDAEPLQIRAVVVDQVCLDSDRVEVTLAVEDNAGVELRYRWDFDHDGNWDGGATADPAVTVELPDEQRVGVVAGAFSADGQRARTRIAFETPACQ
jgi:hypothetical protein